MDKYITKTFKAYWRSNSIGWSASEELFFNRKKTIPEIQDDPNEPLLFLKKIVSFSISAPAETKFRINGNIHDPLTISSLKTFYWNIERDGYYVYSIAFDSASTEGSIEITYTYLNE